MKTTRAVATVRLVMLLVLVAVFTAACADANSAQIESGAGFWRGVAHGAIAPISFVISLFRDDVSVYEIANTGGWYDFGFLLGLGAWHGGGQAGRTRWRSRRDPRDDEAATKRRTP